MSRNTAVFGIYCSRTDVEAAIDSLRAACFRGTDISVVLPKNMGSKALAVQKNTKAPEGTAAGAGSGAVIGGTLGWLVGIGALAIPGIGPFIAAGPIVAALAGVGAGGVLGGIAGGLVGLGIPEYEAKRYAGRIRKGGFLLSILTDDSKWTKKANEVLERTGAEDISITGGAVDHYARSDKSASRSAPGGGPIAA